MLVETDDVPVVKMLLLLLLLLSLSLSFSTGLKKVVSRSDGLLSGERNLLAAVGKELVCDNACICGDVNGDSVDAELCSLPVEDAMDFSTGGNAGGRGRADEMDCLSIESCCSLFNVVLRFVSVEDADDKAGIVRVMDGAVDGIRYCVGGDW